MSVTLCAPKTDFTYGSCLSATVICVQNLHCTWLEHSCKLRHLCDLHMCTFVQVRQACMICASASSLYDLYKYTQLVQFAQLHWACMICTSKLSLHDAQKFTPLVAPPVSMCPLGANCVSWIPSNVDKIGHFTVQSRYIYEHLYSMHISWYWNVSVILL